jgi:hexosaminidase
MSWSQRILCLVAAAVGLALACSCGRPERPSAAVLPAPEFIERRAGNFVLQPTTAIFAEAGSPETVRIAEVLAAHLRRATGYALPVETAASVDQQSGILLRAPQAGLPLGDEGYELIVTQTAARLKARTHAGLFRGVQTLRQLLPPMIEENQPQPGARWILPRIVIRDRPRFAWRGLLLDCSRHFPSKEQVKRYIDLLAFYKINVLHWHLTDDQGWRIEIKQRPKLTEVGAWWGEGAARYGGFYTQGDIREVVAYAAERYVSVVPEIEMPGHSLAALASYPELSCAGGPLAVGTAWGTSEHIFCAGNDATFRFLDDVLSEVTRLFPAAYVHIGGDEVVSTRWRQCAKCQARMRAEGLRDEHALYVWFMNRVAGLLKAKGRRAICWDEAAAAGCSRDIVIQAWHGHEAALAAAAAGHDVIVSPASHCYLDHPLSVIDLARIYSFDPVPAGVTPAARPRILGGECNMWTEYAPPEQLDQKIFPRLLGFAEAVWSPAERSRLFFNRVRQHRLRLQLMGVGAGAGFVVEPQP